MQQRQPGRRLEAGGFLDTLNCLCVGKVMWHCQSSYTAACLAVCSEAGADMQDGLVSCLHLWWELDSAVTSNISSGASSSRSLKQQQQKQCGNHTNTCSSLSCAMTQAPGRQSL